MINIKPFKALRPNPGFAKQVASRPYDVLNSAEARVEVQGNTHSFLFGFSLLLKGFMKHTNNILEQ